jgi:hypothetical protein
LKTLHYPLKAMAYYNPQQQQQQQQSVYMASTGYQQQQQQQQQQMGYNPQQQQQQYQGRWFNMQTKYENGVRHRRGGGMLYDPCTAIEFDTTSESLFAGWGSGRVTCHNLPDLSIHSSYYASDHPILDIKASPLGPLVLTGESLHIFSHGGVPRMKFPSPVRNALIADEKEANLKKYTCMCFNGQDMSTLYVASETEQIHCFDLQYLSVGKSTVRTYDACVVQKETNSSTTSSTTTSTTTTTIASNTNPSTSKIIPITCMCYSPRRLLCCGKADGTIVFYDERTMMKASMLSNGMKVARFGGKAPINRSFTAHPGPVTSINISGDMIVTCGENKKVRRRTLDSSMIEGMVGTNRYCGGK